MSLHSNDNSTNFIEILSLITRSKQNVFSHVNRILIDLYWNIGEYIFTKTLKENWGKGIVKELAQFIRTQEPNLQGFTERNLWRMKQFYETYKDNTKLSPLVTQLSWSNNLLILSASKSDHEREFYLTLSIQERYSKRELERQISSGVYERTQLANHKRSPLIREFPRDTHNVFKDSYALEFLGLSHDHSEYDLQTALITSFKAFILEIGKDFCFMGQEYTLQVGDTDFSIDLLFFSSFFAVYGRF